MKGDLVESVRKGDRVIERRLNPVRVYTAPDGSSLTLHGRSLMLVRNVGHLMTIDAILDRDGKEVPEDILDALFTALIAKHDLLRTAGLRNSRAGSVYLVKPKKNGRASCRERVCEYVQNSVVAGAYKKKDKKNKG